MSTASSIVKDGEFGVKPGKKGGESTGTEENRKGNMTVYENKKTFNGLLESFRKSRGVVAVMLMDHSGNIARTNFNRTASSMYCGISAQILHNTIPLIESLNARIKFRLLRSNAGIQELLVHPVVGGQIVFVIVQNCSDRSSIATSCRPEEKKLTKKRNSESNDRRYSNPPGLPPPAGVSKDTFRV